MTSAVIVLLLVTVGFANNFLNARMAENEFAAMKQFMQTVGLQIDDVAWTTGRTQTIRYSSRFGQVNFESGALNYTVYVNNVYLTSNMTGVLMFNMPVSRYTISNNYHERIFPKSDNSFLQKGTSAPINHVFIVERIPMNDGNYIRVVVAPSVRMLNSTISSGGQTKNYYKFYLPVLDQGSVGGRSESVTLEGRTISIRTESPVTQVKIKVGFPKSGLGFAQDFFSFKSIEETFNIPALSTVEFYAGKVRVTIGVNS